jgi:hypothetical protein
MFSRLLVKNEKNENFIKILFIYLFPNLVCLMSTSTFWGEIVIFMWIILFQLLQHSNLVHPNHFLH